MPFRLIWPIFFCFPTRGNLISIYRDQEKNLAWWKTLAYSYINRTAFRLYYRCNVAGYCYCFSHVKGLFFLACANWEVHEAHNLIINKLTFPPSPPSPPFNFLPPPPTKSPPPGPFPPPRSFLVFPTVGQREGQHWNKTFWPASVAQGAASDGWRFLTGVIQYFFTFFSDFKNDDNLGRARGDSEFGSGVGWLKPLWEVYEAVTLDGTLGGGGGPPAVTGSFLLLIGKKPLVPVWVCGECKDVCGGGWKRAKVKMLRKFCFCVKFTSAHMFIPVCF